MLHGRPLGPPRPGQVGPSARRRRAPGVGGGAGRQSGGRSAPAPEQAERLGRLAGLRVALLLDRVPLGQRRHCGRPRRPASTGRHGGRVVPRARVRRVLAPRPGVQPRGRACRLLAFLLRRSPPLRQANRHLHRQVPAARPETGERGGGRAVVQGPGGAREHAGAGSPCLGLPGRPAPRRPLRDPVAEEQGFPLRLVVWRRGSPGVVQRQHRASLPLPRRRYGHAGVQALRGGVEVEADHREQERPQGERGRDGRLLRRHQEAPDQRRDLHVAQVLARRCPQLNIFLCPSHAVQRCRVPSSSS